MDIVAVIRQVPVTDVTIEFDLATNDIDANDILYTLSRYDLHTVEEALRIRETMGEGRVTIITIGPSQAEDAIRSYLAMGADEGIHIHSQSLSGCDSYELCLALSQAISKTKYDLVICGRESFDDSGCTFAPGPYIAEILALPGVFGVTKINVKKGSNILSVERKIEEGYREIIESSLPCVLAIELGINEPRYPSLPDSLKSITKEITSFDFTPLRLEQFKGRSVETMVKLARLSPFRGRVKKGITIDTGLSPTERMKMAMSGTSASKKSGNSLLMGTPDELAMKVVSTLKSRGIIVERPK